MSSSKCQPNTSTTPAFTHPVASPGTALLLLSNFDPQRMVEHEQPHLGTSSPLRACIPHTLLLIFLCICMPPSPLPRERMDSSRPSPHLPVHLHASFATPTRAHASLTPFSPSSCASACLLRHSHASAWTPHTLLLIILCTYMPPSSLPTHDHRRHPNRRASTNIRRASFSQMRPAMLPSINVCAQCALHTCDTHANASPLPARPHWNGGLQHALAACGTVATP
uniref:Uncharacterized protein n=1 Tax=Dunaliella tertiolecta TaxID=3047 RepID=A0A7S3QYA5_DUNTE